MRSSSLTPRQAVEVFHLLFLRVLAGGSDQRHLVVKGGCNLRFFFGSPRYSEDLDMDAELIAARTLRGKVDRILDSASLSALLRGKGIGIQRAEAAKQTDTTQRWKIGLSIAGAQTILPTKIEFSRRGTDRDHVFEAVDATLAQRYGLVAPLASHYGTSAALRQKIEALAGRREAQARDVFDLQLLLAASPDTLSGTRVDLPAKTLETAMERVTELSFDDYAAQVVAYLEPEQQDLYRSPETWEQMQLDVLNGLGSVGR